MALIIPGQQGSSGLKTPSKKSGGLIIPGTQNTPEAAATLAQRAKIAALRSEVASAEKDAATAQEAAGFLNVLGQTAKSIGQGIGRSFVSGGQAVVELGEAAVDTAKGAPLSRFKDVTSRPFTVETALEQSITGKDKGGKVSFTDIGEEFSPLLEKIGVSPETAKKIAPFSGFFLGSLDIVPIGAGKKQALDLFADTTVKTLAKEVNQEAIYKTIKGSLKGGDAEVRTLAEAISKADNSADVRKILEAATTKPTGAVKVPTTPLPKLEKLTVPAPLKTYAESIVEQAYSKSEFLNRLGRAIESADAEISNAAKLFKQEITEAGFSPGKFYDAAHGRPLARTSELPTQTTTKGAQTRKTIAESIRPAEAVIQRGEYKLLKERIQATARGAKAGAKGAKDDIRRFQTDIISLIQKNLPVALRGKHLVTVRNTTDINKLDSAMDKLADDIVAYEDLRAQAAALNKEGSRIAFIRKIAELNQTAVNDAKKALGINKPLRKMDLDERKRLAAELIERLKFKKANALFEKTAAPKSPTELSERQIDEYLAAMNGATRFKKRAIQNLRNTGDALRKSGDLITIPSEALRAIGAEPVLTALRKMGAQARKYTMEGEKVTSEIISKLGLNRKLGRQVISDRDYAALDLAMKNGATDTVMQIADKYGVRSEFEQLRPILDDVFKRANDVDLEVEYRSNFFPRSFKEDAATRDAATAYFEKEYGDVLTEAYSDFATKMGRAPTAEEKWKLINNLMRGFKQQGVTLSKTGSLKRRRIEEVTPATADFYQDSFSALQTYFESANNLIEARRFFGKHVDLKNIPGETELRDIAGVVIDKLVARGELNPKHSERLREILQARFTGGQMNSFLRLWKNGSYLSIMGDVISAVTQLGDFEKVMYRAGLRNSAPAIFNAVFNPTAQQVRLADLGLEKTIAAEMNTPSATGKMVNDVFKSVGLSWIDRLGKESFINGTIAKYKQAIESGDEAFLETARRILGDEAPETFEAIAKGDMTENVKFLALNELADFFPVTLEEVPIQYLNSPNGRIFYTMKTFTTKQLNTYRREIFREARKDPVQAAKNAARLIGFFMVMNMTADEVKSWIRGEDKGFTDKLVDNMLKTIGFGKYQLDQASAQGFGRTVLEQALPPTAFVDDAVKDFNDVFVKRDADKGLRSTKNIPVGGELYYWWFGRGAGSESSSTQKENTSVSIPSVQLPSVTVPTIRIPNVSI